MKSSLRKLFAPLLNIFEQGTEAFAYQKSHRIILIVMGFLFMGLAGAVLYFAMGQDLGYLIPVVVFGSVGFVSLIIGSLGTDRAVAKIWGSK